MKKQLIILSALLFAGATFSLQTIAQGRFALGVKAGYNSSKFRTDNAEDIIKGTENYTFSDAKEEAKNGLMLGAFARIKLINKLSIQPELLYVKKGGKTIANTDMGNVSINSTYHTWDIPLLAHLKLIDLKFLNIYGVGGPVASFTAKENDNWYASIDDVNEFSDNIKSALWSFQTGGGIEIGRLNLDVRYSWGLGDSSTKLERVNNNLTFSIGYKIFDF
ncbi:porin family protein [Thermophagus sp. OGC60D27]|uniref:porin family protein n=1 Tax=Thermophagus sp. OGC60D27 TaxID=3458415 RepID=UPI0040378DA1